VASFWCGVRFRYGLRLGSKRCSLRFKTRFCAIHTSASPRGADVARVRLSAWHVINQPTRCRRKRKQRYACTRLPIRALLTNTTPNSGWVPDQSTLGECGGHPCARQEAGSGDYKLLGKDSEKHAHEPQGTQDKQGCGEHIHGEHNHLELSHGERKHERALARL